MFELEKHFDGYVIYRPTSMFTAVYVRSYRNGVYKYTTDYAYAKTFTESTARKHLKALNA